MRILERKLGTHRLPIVSFSAKATWGLKTFHSLPYYFHLLICYFRFGVSG